MKVLFITAQFPFPLDNGGKIGAYNGLSVVSTNNEVTCLSFTENPEYTKEGIRFFAGKLPNLKFENPIIHDIHIRNKKIKLFNTMLKGYITNRPYVTSKFDNNEMFKLIDKCFLDNKWDIVFVDYLNMYIYGEYIQKKYKNSYKLFVFKDHNKEYEIVKQAADNMNGAKKHILKLEWKRTLVYEKKAIAKADLVFSVCEDNTKFMKQFNRNSYTMLPTFSINECDSVANNNKILYIGSLSWGANIEGVKWFANEVLPLIRKEIPDATLTIVGSGPTENPFCDTPGVIYKGYVKNIDGIYKDYSVFVVPLFQGSGIRIKILDAFNNNIPVVSTLIGCGTINAEDGHDIMIANNIDDFSTAVIRLLTSKEMRVKITTNAKEFLRRNFSLIARVEEFESVIRGKMDE